MLVPSHLVAVSTLGLSTALVLDVGYKEATLIPICEGVPVLKAWQALPLAGKAVHEYVLQLIKNEFVELMIRTLFNNFIIKILQIHKRRTKRYSA